MSTVNGFQVGSETLKYNYESLENYNTPNFSTSLTYEVGDYVIYQGKLYKCSTAVETAGSWNSSNWTLAVLSDDVSDLKNAISELNNTVGGQFEQTYTYERPAGDTGTNWNNEADIDIPQGTSFYVVCNSYSGTKFSKLRLWGYTTSNQWVELASTTGIGVAINVVASATYTRLRFMLVQSSLEAPCSATYTVWEDATGLVSNVENIKNDVNALEETTFELNMDKPYNLIPTDMVWTAHSYINNGDGATVNVTDTTSEYYPCYSSDYIPIDSSKGYICNYITVPRELYDEENDTHISQVAVPFNRFMYAFYTDEKVFVATSSANSATSKAIPQTAKYIKVTVVNSDMIPFARLIYGNYVDRPNLRVVEYKETLPKNYYKAPTGYEDFKMVLFGDSITAGPASGFCIADYASDYLNSNIISVGFGGTRMTYDLVGAGLFCFYHLCDCIVSDDPTVWNDLDTYVENMESTIKPNYVAHLATLKAIDWSTVNAVGILYGANDYSSNTPVGNSFNTTLTNYDGACAYGIQKLLTKYPHLQILLFTPFFGLTTMGDYNSGMDVIANSAGLYIQDYGESLKNVQEGLHVPIVNTMQELGINKYTLKYYSDDGLHPRTQQALFRLGHKWANIIQRYISPF